MASSSGTCEIVEAKEELNSFRHYSGSSKTASAFRVNVKDPKLPMLKVTHSKYAEDDINQLFKAINLKSSSKSLDLSDQAKRDFYRKNALKKPVGHGMPYSPRSEITETVTLKKALRGLSISHASEVAATKRLSKSSHSPGASEAGRITSLYRSVVVDSNQSSPSFNKGKGSIVELCFVQEECSSSFSVKSPPCLQYTKATTSVESMAPVQKEINSTLTGSGKETLRIGLNKKNKDAFLPPLSSPDNGENSFELHKEVYASTKISNKVSPTKKGRKSRLKTVVVASSSTGNTLNTKNNHRLAKPVFKKRNLGKNKSNQDLTSTACTLEIYKEINGVIDPDNTQMVCHKCQCTIKSAKAESQEASSISHSANDISTGPCKPKEDAVIKNNKNVKSKDKGEFSQSSKSSLGENSTSTSASDESNLSRSSCGNRPHMSKDVRWEAIKHVKRHHGNLGLSHFNLLKKLGCGDIGTVYLAELIGANCLFAIKVMDNEYLAKRKKMPRAQTEREILRMLDHPFLPTLFSQFTSDNLSCLVMEYCPGGDLHVLRQKQDGRKFPEQAARFYVAEVLLALEYLHMLGVVYRDLKPENILVREDGHIMLTDFDLSLRCSVSPILLKSSSTLLDPPRISGPCTGSGCIDPFCSSPSCQVSCFTPRVFPSKKSQKSQKLKSEQKNAIARSLLQLVAEPTDARSNSFVGTHEYLAPEIIKGEGHGSAVDWWTFGIFLYELLYGKTPFKGSGNEDTLGNVVLQSLTFPDSPLVSLQARDLIRGLLVKEPKHRFGSEKGAAEIKKHPFFEGINWALIRCVNPPELPEIYDYEIGSMGFQDKKSRFLEATGNLVEFELF